MAKKKKKAKAPVLKKPRDYKASKKRKPKAKAKKLKATITKTKDQHLKVKKAIQLIVARPSGPKDGVGKEVRIFMPEYRRTREKRVFIFTNSMIHCDMKGLVMHPVTKQWLCRVFKGKDAKQRGLDLITQLRGEGKDCTMVIRTGFVVKHEDMVHSFAHTAGFNGLGKTTLNVALP